MRSMMLVSLLLCGCGRSDLTDDVPQRLPQPVTACESTCAAAPPGVVTPLNDTEGPPLHWLTCAGCVRVTVDEALPAAFVARAPELVRAWADAAGPTLCLAFDAAPASPPGEDTLQQLHLAPRKSAEGPAQITSVTFDVKTGRIRNATVEVSDGVAVDRQLVFGLGQALGLSSSRADERSAMTPRLEHGLTRPGPDDTATLRAMYGDEQPWCERP